MIKDHDAWKRSTRAIDQMKERLVEAQFEEQFQGIGHLAREAFISMAQAVHDPVRHPSEDGTAPSATDAKRMLDSYVAAELAGAAREEARRFARAAVVYADAVTHKRSAIRTDAELVVAAIDGVARIIAILGQVGPPEDPWSGIDVDGRYFAWSGPTLHQLPDRPPVREPSVPDQHVRARTVRHRSPEHRGSVEVDPGGRPRRCNRRPRHRGGTKTDEVRSCLGGQGRATTYLMASPS